MLTHHNYSIADFTLSSPTIMGTESQHIAIIGGGFCGIMTAVHLLENALSPVKITLINSGYPFAKGVAYSAYSDSHLLNIVAGKMSAYTDKPTDFVDWVHVK
ncbi:MAG TPA: FAD/NAD(P)-binding protein, partial [Bacteroidia bacterium]|nr:FAD/NAD(P)-binding protein [Bacteroidia bacterium]